MPCAVPEKTSSGLLPVSRTQGVEYPASTVYRSIFHRVFPVLRSTAIRKLLPGVMEASFGKNRFITYGCIWSFASTTIPPAIIGELADP